MHYCSSPFLPHLGIIIEQFYDMLRSNKKDTKISPDVFDIHIQRGWGFELRIFLKILNVNAFKKLYIYFFLYC